METQLILSCPQFLVLPHLLQESTQGTKSQLLANKELIIRMQREARGCWHKADWITKDADFGKEIIHKTQPKGHILMQNQTSCFHPNLLPSFDRKSLIERLAQQWKG